MRGRAGTSKRREESETGEAIAKVKAELALRTGPCETIGCTGCDGYQLGGYDVFHWPICRKCTHTPWSHAEVQQ